MKIIIYKGGENTEGNLQLVVEPIQKKNCKSYLIGKCYKFKTTTLPLS